MLYEFEGVLDFVKDADTNKLVVEVEDYVCPREIITELNKLKKVTAELRGAQQGSQNNQAQFHNKFGSMVIGESSKGTAKHEKLSHMTCRQRKTMGTVTSLITVGTKDSVARKKLEAKGKVA